MREILIESVGHRYERPGLPSFLVLDEVSLKCKAGSFTSLIGPSGCGKSTLLRLISGLESPEKGFLYVGNESPRALQRSGRLGFATQDATLLPWRSVQENIRFPLEIIGEFSFKNEEKVTNLIKLVGLCGFENALPSQLSGGMRQRVSIARALVTEPDVLLLDEPFGALDLIMRRNLNQELQRILQDKKTTTLLVTHGIDEAVFLSDYVAVMCNRPGRIAKVIDIPLKRPRHFNLFLKKEFRDLEEKVFRALYEHKIPD